MEFWLKNCDQQGGNEELWNSGSRKCDCQSRNQEEIWSLGTENVIIRKETKKKTWNCSSKNAILMQENEKNYGILAQKFDYYIGKPEEQEFSSQKCDYYTRN